jgi:hypothetical protein
MRVSLCFALPPPASRRAQEQGAAKIMPLVVPFVARPATLCSNGSSGNNEIVRYEQATAFFISRNN